MVSPHTDYHLIEDTLCQAVNPPHAPEVTAGAAPAPPSRGADRSVPNDSSAENVTELLPATAPYVYGDWVVPKRPL